MKFVDVKKIPAWDILMQLQKTTRENIKQIKENNDFIQMVLRSEIQNESLGKLQARNNELLRENSENLKLHNNLLTYLKSLQNSDDFNIATEIQPLIEADATSVEVKKLGFDEYLKMTIDGSIAFDSNHPYFCSEVFKQKLIQYYTSIEEYEKCAQLSAIHCN